MPQIEGVKAYVKKSTAREKAYVEELSAIVKELCGEHLTLASRCTNLITQLRNQSRDVGWMRRLLADLTKEWVDRAEEEVKEHAAQFSYDHRQC